MPREKYILGLCLLCSLCVGYYFFGLLLPAANVGARARDLAGGYAYGNDFYQVWLTSKELLAHRTDPYTPEMQQHIEIGLYGRPLDRTARRDGAVPYRGYSYPLQANLLLAPIGLMPFRDVQILLSIVLPLCVVASVVFWSSAFGLRFAPYTLASLSAVTLGSCAVLEGIYALQPTLMVSALMAGSLALLRKGRMGIAGVLLALGSIKPHLIVFLALWLMLWSIGNWPRRKTFFIAFVVASAAMMLATQLWVPGWWMEWWHSLSAYRQVNSAPLAELVLGKVLGRALGFLMIVLAIAVGVRWRRSSVDSPSFLLVSTFVMAITMVVASSSVAVYDQILLLPAALWLWSERRSILRADWPLRVISLLLLAAFVWPFVTGAALAVASPVLPWARSLRAVLIPLATAASFPLIVLTLLTLLLWRRVRDGASDSVPAEAAIVVTPES